MGKGAPDYTRVTEIRGQDPTGELVTLAVDANGQLYAVIKGTDGTTLRTIAVDASGRIIMVPYGVTSISGTATVTQAEKDREVQGKDGVTLRTLAVDASGQLIMVPRGQSGNYMSVDASGFMTSVMKGVDGVTLRTVAVDSNGNIIGVLQGDYAGNLKTLAVDDKGRMLAVLTDPEDVFGNPNYMGAAELAARLGCISVFERRGQVLFMDDFESGLGRWDPASAGGLGTVDLTTLTVRSGRYACRLLTSPSSPYYVQIARHEPYPVLGKYGLEAAIHTDGSEDYTRIGLYLASSVTRWRFLLELDPVDQVIRYMNSTGTWTVIQSIGPVDAFAYTFHRLKLVVDLVNKQYVRGFFDNYAFSLAGIAGNESGVEVADFLYVLISAASLDSTQRAIRVDDIILTQNEPA